MTILEKLSDRGGFVYEAILLVLNNTGTKDVPALQWELFKCGVYVKKPLLMQALAVMKEKNLISKNEKKADVESTPAAIQPQA